MFLRYRVTVFEFKGSDPANRINASKVYAIQRMTNSLLGVEKQIKILFLSPRAIIDTW